MDGQLASTLGRGESEGPHPGGYAGAQARSPTLRARRLRKRLRPRTPHATNSQKRSRRTQFQEVGTQKTRAVQNWQLVETQEAQFVPATATSQSLVSLRRATVRRPGQQPHRASLRCAQCGTDPQAYVGNSDHGLMTHISQKHGADSHTRKHCSAATAAPRCLCGIKHLPITARKSLQSLSGGHCDERLRSSRSTGKAPRVEGGSSHRPPEAPLLVPQRTSWMTAQLLVVLCEKFQ